MVSRRDFLKRAALATAGSALAVSNADAISNIAAPIIGAKKNVNINRKGKSGKMTLRFFPYELKLQHVFTVATYTRTTTPDVQVEIEYEGVTGYGEASMPPYLGQTVAALCQPCRVVDLLLRHGLLHHDHALLLEPVDLVESLSAVFPSLVHVHSYRQGLPTRLPRLPST